MTGFSDYWGRKLLDLTTGKAGVSTPTVYVALFSAVGLDDGTGFTELSGSGYARVATTAGNWNSASGTSPSATSNNASIVFPSASGTWSAAIAWGLYDASSGGNLLFWDYLGNSPWIPFTCSSASPGVITAPAHGFSNSDSMVINATEEYGGVLPTLASGSWSGTKSVSSASTDTFNVGLNTTSTGGGQLRKIASVTITSGQAFVFDGGTPGDLQLMLA